MEFIQQSGSVYMHAALFQLPSSPTATFLSDTNCSWYSYAKCPAYAAVYWLWISIFNHNKTDCLHEVFGTHSQLGLVQITIIHTMESTPVHVSGGGGKSPSDAPGVQGYMWVCWWTALPKVSDIGAALSICDWICEKGTTCTISECVFPSRHQPSKLNAGGL